MPVPQIMLMVRMQTTLPIDEVMRVAEERAPEFEALTGLRQKYYVHDTQTGEIGGCYIWDSPEAFDSYRESELRSSIAAAYRTTGQPRIEVMRILKVLRD